MIASCLVRQKTTRRYKFDYVVPGNLNLDPLSLVEVPFLNKKVSAVITGFKQTSPFAKKEIIRSLSTNAVFTAEQLKLAEEMAFEFLSDPSQAIFSFLPKLNKKDLLKIPPPVKASFSRKCRTIFIESSFSNRLQYFIQKIDPGKQNLLVFSKLDQITKTAAVINKLNPSIKILLWHSGLSSSQKASAWSKIISGEKYLVISTRHGLFLPFRNLENIYLDSPCDFGYYEDQEPRYNAFRASRIISKIYHANLLLADSSPSAEIYALIKDKRIEKVELKNDIDIVKLPNLSAIFSCDDFKACFKKSRKVLVSGYFQNITRLVCEDCEKQILCPNCQKPVFGQSTGKCISCETAGPMACPICSGIKIKQSFFSKTNVAKALQKYLDCDVSEDENSSAKVIIKPLNELDDLKPLFDLAIFPYFEYTSGLPFLNSQVNLVRTIRELPSLGIKKLFVSTNKTIELAYLLEDKKFDQILENELKSRSDESMPPFTRYLEMPITKNISEDIKQLLGDMLHSETKRFSFLKHREVERLQKIFAKDHPNLKCRLDSPDYC